MTTYNVRLDEDGSKPYSPEFQSQAQFAQGWKAVLAKTHQSETAMLCGCPGKGDKKLSVRYYDDSDSYGLARYPFSGEQHSNDCRFYAPNTCKSGMSGYSENVIEEGPGGSVRIKLEVGLRRKEARADNEAPPPPQASRKPGQPAMRTLGLLHYLWEQAALNTWWPAMQGKRTQWLVNTRLREAAKAVSITRIGLDRILMLGGSRDDRDTARNTETLAQAIRNKRRLVVITPMAKYRLIDQPTTLPIAGFGGIPILSMAARQWDKLRERFPRAMAAWEDGTKLIAIAVIEPRDNNPRFARVADLAVMAVTDNYIPVESSFEKRIADKLTAEGRGFIKPLRFDAENDAVFPDFILRDTGTDTPLEVFGRSDEAYAARKEIKAKYYRDQFGVDGWWCWDAAADPSGSAIPPFPETHRRAAKGG